MRASCTIGALLAACAGPAEVPPDAPRSAAAPTTVARVEGPIVAHVDGDPIALADVEAVARATGLSPIEALHRLEDERVLAHAAAAAGTTADAELERTARRALVQALLADEIEARVTDATLDPAVVEARIAQDRHLFVRPERRRSTHVLLRRREGVAEADAAGPMAERAAAIAETLRSATTPGTLAHDLWDHDPGPADAPYELVVEDVPPSSRAGRLDPAYTEALFALATPGDVSAPTTSSFGVHVIVLTGIEEPFSAPEEEIRTIVRRQLVSEARAEALVALEDRLLAASPPMIDERIATSLLLTELEELAP